MLNRLILFLSTFNLISIVIISISSEMSVISEIIYGELYLVLCIVLSIISEIAIFCHFTLGRSITLDFIQAIVSLLNFILTAVVYINFYFSYYKIKSPVTENKKKWSNYTYIFPTKYNNYSQNHIHRFSYNTNYVMNSHANNWFNTKIFWILRVL